MNDHRGRAAKLLLSFVALLCTGTQLPAHPMGNFSINHYALVMPGAHGVEVLYVLDFAELPTLQLLQSWDLKKDSARADFERKTRAAAEDWMGHLKFTANGFAVQAHLERTDYATQEGAGGLPVLRVNAHIKIPASPGDFAYEDRNFEQRAGWKEVVIEARAGASVSDATPAGADRSRALTAYPQDPTLAPPQDISARFDWAATAPVMTQSAPSVRPAAPLVTQAAPPATDPAPVSESAPSPAAAVATGATPVEAHSYGTVKRGDFLSRTLTQSKGSLPLSLALICLAAAFGVGALHAVEPGHGKTMVAAYLVGSRGTIRQALFLGGMVTFTHTISVFALGVVTLFLSQYVLPETLTRVMGVISGVSIIWIGGLLLYRRGQKLWSHPATAHSHSHAHDHHHAHDHGHAHTHDGHTHEHGHSHEHDHAHHSHEHAHEHAHQHHEHGNSAALTHTHDGHTHSHVPEGEVTLGNLVALGVSGGLVPCPAALVLLLSCISIGRPAFGLLLLIAFSLGLALVLMLIGVMVLVVKNSVPKSNKPSHAQLWARYAPVASAALIFGIGIYMTGVAVGAFPVVRLIG